MHLVSSEGVTGATQQALFMPMLTRMPKQRVKMLVMSMSPDAVPGPVLRQNGVPVYDVALSKQRFSVSSFKQLIKTARAFRPDVIQAWGHTAQIASTWLRKRCDWQPRVVWSVSSTTPLPRKAGMVDRQKLQFAAKAAVQADRIVYTSEAAASAHRRVGFPEDGHTVIPLGVDPTRFKPDLAVRRKVREQLGLAHDAFVIGMLAPFQAEYDHATLFKAIGELVKTNPNIAVLLAGHGIQKGNGPLMALVGGGTLGTRTQLLGEWSDIASFFNACDVACSSALTDSGRMPLVMAMLCGVPCVATGMGAQGEVIGQFGVAIEPGSSVALIRGITRVMQLPQDKRVFMAQGARKHALANFVSIRSLQKYLQMYFDLVGRSLAATTAVPAPDIDPSIPVPTDAEKTAMAVAPKPKANRTVDMYELSDPDSLEARDRPLVADSVVTSGEGDVLHLFESRIAQQTSTATSPMSERARGVAELEEDLLSPDMLNSGASSALEVSGLPLASPPPVAKTAAKAATAPLEQNGQAMAGASAAEASSADPFEVAVLDSELFQASAAKREPTQAPASKPLRVREARSASVDPIAAVASQPVDPIAIAAARVPDRSLVDPIAAALSMADAHETVVSTARIQDSDVRADSITVPALAVDALLSSAAQEPTTQETPQLDLLASELTDKKLVVG